MDTPNQCGIRWLVTGSVLAAIGVGLGAFGVIDQATCCLNVIDFDVHKGNTAVLRKVVRGMNITAGDPTKSLRHSGDMEALARHLMSFAE